MTGKKIQKSYNLYIIQQVSLLYSCDICQPFFQQGSWIYENGLSWQLNPYSFWIENMFDSNSLYYNTIIFLSTAILTKDGTTSPDGMETC